MKIKNKCCIKSAAQLIFSFVEVAERGNKKATWHKIGSTVNSLCFVEMAVVTDRSYFS